MPLDCLRPLFSLFKGDLHLRALLDLKPLPSEKEIKDYLEQTIKMYMKAYQA